MVVVVATSVLCDHNYSIISPGARDKDTFLVPSLIDELSHRDKITCM